MERVEVRMRGAPREPHTRVQEGSANQETQRKDSTKSYTQHEIIHTENTESCSG